MAEGVSARIYLAKGKGHKQLDEKLGLAGDVSTQVVFQFLESLLRK